MVGMRKPTRGRRPSLRLAVSMVLTCGIIAGVVLGSSRLLVERAAAGRVYPEAGAVPERRVAIVLGAGVWPDGTPSPMLADRVRGAVELYRLGRVDHLLMTGDNGTVDYDEPTVMRRIARAAGVPAEAITLDFAGFSTHDSCARAQRIFRVSDAVVVTQDFHIDRAVYLCRQAGIDTIGYVPPPSPAAAGRHADLAARDTIASVKAVWDAQIRRAGPTLGGPVEGLTGSVRPANGE